jgi:hypothetical protein
MSYVRNYFVRRLRPLDEPVPVRSDHGAAAWKSKDFSFLLGSFRNSRSCRPNYRHHNHKNNSLFEGRDSCAAYYDSRENEIQMQSGS